MEQPSHNAAVLIGWRSFWQEATELALYPLLLYRERGKGCNLHQKSWLVGAHRHYYHLFFSLTLTPIT